VKELDKYFKLRQEIFDYFGYVEDWVVLPFDDARDYYWRLRQEENGSGYVEFGGPSPEDIGIYINEIYTQRFLPKWVYRGKDYTMICVNPRVDGNRFLQIFDNSKEVKK
jgi:hypothetical protein